MVTALAAGLKKAGSTDAEKLITAFEGLEFPSPFGKASFRAIDHQSTMGIFVGKTALKDGKGVMVDFRYEDGAKFMPPDSVVKNLRPDAP
jgi:branched-chain amino acid transport system substrate-binding protein